MTAARARSRLSLGLVGVLVALAATGSSGGAAGSPAAEPAAPAYGILTPSQRGKPVELVRVDPKTLEPLAGRRVALGAAPGFSTRSPDGRFAAFADPRRAVVRVVDLGALRARPDVPLRLGTRWRIRATAWLTADRLVVVAQRMRGSYDQIVAERSALVVDPLARRIVATRPIGAAGAVIGSESGGDELVLLLGRGDLRPAPLSVVAIDAAGRVRSTSVPASGTSRQLPSLAVEPSGRRAFLVRPGAPVFEVDLETGRAASHAVAGGGAVFAPAPLASRRALWLGDGRLAVTGSNTLRVGRVETSRPAGLALVDTATWRARVLDASASGVSASEGTVLAHGFRLERAGRGQRLSGIGVRAYDAAGTRRWHRFAGQAATAIAFRDRVLVHRYVSFRAPVPVVLDLATGREVGRVQRSRAANLSLLPDVQGAARFVKARPAEPAIRVRGDGESFSAQARPDVTRVVAVLVDGSDVELSVRQGAVTYRAASPEDAAQAVHAYVGDRLVATVAVSVRCGGATGPCGAAAAGGGPVYAIFGELPAGDAILARVDPRTLRPQGRALRLGDRYGPLYARSPDGRFVALAAWDRPLVRIVDLRRLRDAGTLTLGGRPGTSIRAFAWPAGDKLLAVTQRLSLPNRRYVRERALVAVDPGTRRVVSRRALPRTLAVHGAESAAGRLVLQLRSSSFRGSTVRVVVADADGRVRSRLVEVGRTRGALNQTALVVEPSGRRAFVVAWAIGRATPPVLELDLDTLALRRHALRLERPGSLAPAGVSFLSAYAVDDSHLAATGAVSTADGRRPAAGLLLVDTRSWTARVLDPRAPYARVHEGRIVTYGASTRLRELTRPAGRGSGITAYEPSGRRLYHLYGDRPFSRVELAGDYGHVFLGPRREGHLAFDARAGRALGTLQRVTRPVEVLRPPPPAASRVAVPSTPTVAARAQADPFARVSNRGTRVRARARSPQEREYVPRELFLLRRAEGRAVYRIGGLRREFRACYALGDAARLGELGATSCGRLPFPSRRLPIFDMSSFQFRRGQASSRLYRLAGVAADGVAEIGLTDAAGAVIARVPVEGNVYLLSAPPPSATHSLLAFDRDGNVVYRNDRPPARPPTPSNPRLLAGYRIRLTLPPGWVGRLGRSSAGPARASITAASFPLPRGRPNRAPVGETLVLLDERDPRARPAYPHVAGAPRLPRVVALQLRPRQAIARRPFTLNGRQFDLRVHFGTQRPSAAALAEVNALLRSLRVGAIAVAPTGAPPGRPVQQASADGVEVTVYAGGAVVFRFTPAFRAAPLLRGRRATVACVTFDSTSPWETNEVWVSRPFREIVRIDLDAPGRPALPYTTLDPQTRPRPPLDGCLVSGPYGRRWNDPRGQRSPAEIAFTAAGRRFFDERAVARDLALFVRSPVLAGVRRAMKRGSAAPPASAIARRLPSRVVALRDRLATPPHDRIGVWTDGAQRLEVSERSPAGKRLFVEVRGGRIHRHNVAGLAFVF